MPKRLLPGALLLAAASFAHAADRPLPEGPFMVPAQPEVAGLVSDRSAQVPGEIPQADAATLDALLSAAGLRVAHVRSGTIDVPRLYAAALPTDMAQIDQAAERKRIFIKVMLPLVLAANERLETERAEIADLRARVVAGGSLSSAEMRWLDGMAELFYAEPGDLDDLLERVDVIPPSLALAQAAQESGWGTSRFAQVGNAVFGQRTWDDGAGLDPAGLADAGFEVKAFSGLKDAVFAYLVNLNRHPAYAHLRSLRADLRARGVEPDGPALAAGLDEYAEEPAYVQKIRDLIAINRLTDFDGARLAGLD